MIKNTTPILFCTAVLVFACSDIQVGCQKDSCDDLSWTQCQLTCGRCAESSARPNSGKKFVMYYPAWATYARDYQVADIDASKLTHITYGFVNIANGECVLGDRYADTEKFFANTDDWDDPQGTLRGNFNQLLHLKQKNPQLKVMMSIGGWKSSSSFSGLAASADGRIRFAQSCAAFMQKYKFDGIDIDWEFPVTGGGNIPHLPEDRENFTLLLQALRAAMNLGDGVHYELSIATTASPAQIPVSYDVLAINDVLDFVNLMAYDFNGVSLYMTGHNAPLFANSDASNPSFNVDEAVETFLSHGLAREKLLLGLAFYGRGWTSVETTTDGLFSPARGPSPGTWEKGVLDYSDLVENYINKNGFTRYWDDVSRVPYLYNPNNRVFISYDDEESICMKVGYLMKHDLGGGMVWQVTSDYKNTLQNLAYDIIVGRADSCHLE